MPVGCYKQMRAIKEGVTMRGVSFFVVMVGI